LRQPAARAELGLKAPDLLFRRDDLPLDRAELVALRRDLQRHHIATQRRSTDGGDPGDGLESSGDHPGIPSLDWPQGAAFVRLATRKVAERARGLDFTSASPARTGFATASKLGLGPRSRRSGRWREPEGRSPLRSFRNRFTTRSSRLWKVTTARRPPGFSTCSAASRPPSSS